MDTNKAADVGNWDGRPPKVVRQRLRQACGGGLIECKVQIANFRLRGGGGGQNIANYRERSRTIVNYREQNANNRERKLEQESVNKGTEPRMNSDGHEL